MLTKLSDLYVIAYKPSTFSRLLYHSHDDVTVRFTSKFVSHLDDIEGIVHDLNQARDIGIEFHLRLNLLRVFVSGEQI